MHPWAKLDEINIRCFAFLFTQSAQMNYLSNNKNHFHKNIHSYILSKRFVLVMDTLINTHRFLQGGRKPTWETLGEQVKLHTDDNLTRIYFIVNLSKRHMAKVLTTGKDILIKANKILSVKKIYFVKFISATRNFSFLGEKNTK